MANLDATFFAFKRREQRFVLTCAAVGYCIGYAVLMAAYVALLWPSLTAFYAWYFEILGQVTEGGGTPPVPPEALLSRWPLLVLFALLGMVLFAAFEAACLRWLVRGERGGGLLGLTLGRGTWLVLAVYLAWFAVFIAFCVLVVTFYAGLRLLGEAVPVLQLLWMLLAALAPLVLLGLMIWGAVRLAPAAALTVARDRFAFFGAWSATRAYFWPLLGAFVILWIGYFVIAMVIGTIAQIPMNQAMAPVIQEAMRGGEPAELAEQLVAAWSSPVVLASLGVNLVASVILACVLYIAVFGVNARMAQAAGARPEDRAAN